MSGRFNGKVVVITGGNSGIGLATAQAFANEGAALFISGRKQASLDQAVEKIGGAVTAVLADVSRLSDIDRLYDAVRQKHDHIDVLFANAGGGDPAPFGQITEEQYHAIFDTNVKGTLFTVQKALPLLRNGASVILTGSSTTIVGTPALSVYGASKAAIRNFARNWILDLKGRGIRINVLSPGPTETPGLVGLVGTDPDKQRQFLASFADEIPLGRVGQPQEIAKAVLFLASDDASFVTGVELFVDGGAAQI